MAAPYPEIGTTDPNHPLEVEGQVFISNVEQGSATNKVPFEIFSDYTGASTEKIVGARQLRLRVIPSLSVTSNVNMDMGIEPTSGSYFYITPPIEDTNLSSNAAFRIVQSGDIVMANDLSITTDLSVTGTTAVGGDLSVTGTGSISQMTVSGAVTTPSIVCTGTVTTSNINGDAALYINGTTTVGGDLSVTGTGSISQMTVSGAVTTGALSCTGTVTTSNINGDAALYINGTTTVGGDLSVTGSITADGNITAYSDKRLKSDIKRIENALEKLTSIGGYTYMMNGMTNTGLIAQEVLEILPEAVSGSEDTKYALAYGNLMGIVVEAIKELKEDVEKIKNKINI